MKGDIFLQNLPSIIAAHVLDPQQGERILDMCAAPGGKTTAIASLMKRFVYYPVQTKLVFQMMSKGEKVNIQVSVRKGKKLEE